MRNCIVVGVLAVALLGGRAQAGSREVLYGPPPAWVIDAPAPSLAPPPPAAPLKVVYSDQQMRFSHGADELYTRWRIKILGPQGLAIGNLNGSWNPTTDELTVSALKIYRDGQVVDVLSTVKFQIIQRENNLEQSSLDGTLTAALQIPGLQIGDEVEFSTTLKHQDTVFGGRSQGFAQLPTTTAPGVFRARALWPSDKAVKIRVSPDLKAAPVTAVGPDQQTIYELRDPTSAIATDGAPPRYNLRRFVQFSEFASWAEISASLAPLFEQAEELAPDSPVRGEIARIAKTTDDPRERTEAALRLVENQIRYVYVGLNGANYLPQTADQTWRRRYGDCKAKTVLLLAILRGLGVEGQAVVVNAKGVDGLDERLPTPIAFDHVVVRVKLGGAAYWLDPTRLGDQRLSALQPPIFGWGLPIAASRAELERIEQPGPILPLHSIVLDVDARGGFDAPAKVSAEEVWRGAMADDFRSKLTGLAKEDAERALKAYWRNATGWVDADVAAWRGDDTQGAVILTMTGQGTQKWDGDAKTGRTLDIYAAGFIPPNELKRPAEQDQTAPWSIDFPSFNRRTTVIRLPAAGPKWKWAFAARPVGRTLGGVSYWREMEIRNGVLISTMSTRSIAPEISAQDAAELDRQLPGFDNLISRLYQAKAASAPKTVPFPRTELIVGKAAIDVFDSAKKDIRANNYPAALIKLDDAIRLEPEAMTFFKSRAAVLRELGRHREALADYEEVLRVDPFDEVMQQARDEERATIAREPAKP